ncbi:MAG TPA: hypothetical protein VI461_11760 [Chitinophagaceae bacterium]|nr:hypothetical protein [Chitinophagaceae bacterium]
MSKMIEIKTEGKQLCRALYRAMNGALRFALGKLQQAMIVVMVMGT